MVSYEKLLLPGEKVKSVGSPHAMALAKRLGSRAVLLVGLWLMARAAGSELVAKLLDSPVLREAGPGGGPLPLGAWVGRACWLLALAVLVAGVFDFLRWRGTRYVVTDQRLLHVWGVLDLGAMDSPLDKVTDIGLEQSWLGRLLDYGDVLVLRNTEDGGNRLSAVETPLGFKQALHKARAARVAPPAMAANNVQAALKELLAMREHGLVTDDEFDAKKKDLLARF